MNIKNHGLATPLGVLALALLMAQSPQALAQETITAVNPGYSQPMRDALYTPTEKALGIQIKDTTTTNIADIRAQVLSNAVSWDVVETGSKECAQLKAENNLEPLDYSVIKTEGIDGKVIDSHWAGLITFSTVMAWKKDKYGDNPPKSWADFFDVEKFPGTRSIRNKPFTNLEIALLADGVAPADVYATLKTKEGLDRAYKKIETLAPHVSVWWASGAQSAQLIKDGEADMIMVYNNRAASTIADGANYAYTFKDGIYDFDCLVVPRGAKNVATSMKVINEFLKPENQANIPAVLPFGPINQKAFDTGKIPDAKLGELPSSPANKDLQLVFDPSFYTGQYDVLQSRLDEIVTGN